MKVVYKTILTKIEEEIEDAICRRTPIDYIELNLDEWVELHTTLYDQCYTLNENPYLGSKQAHIQGVLVKCVE